MKKINLYNFGLVFILNFAIFAILVLLSILIYNFEHFSYYFSKEFTFFAVHFLIFVIYTFWIIFLLKKSTNKKYLIYFNLFCGGFSFILMLVDAYLLDFWVDTLLMCVYVLLFSFIHFFIKYSNFNRQWISIIKKSVIFWFIILLIHSAYWMSLEFNRIEHSDLRITEHGKKIDLKNWIKIYDINDKIINSNIFTQFADCYKRDSYKVVCVKNELFWNDLAKLNEKKYKKETGFNYLEERKKLVLWSIRETDLDKIIELEKNAFEIKNVTVRYQSYHLSNLKSYDEIKNKNLWFIKLYELLIDYYISINNKEKAEFYISRFIDWTTNVATVWRHSQYRYLYKYIEYTRLYQLKFNEKVSIETELLELKDLFKLLFIDSELSDIHHYYWENNFKILFLYNSQEIVNRNFYYLQKIKNWTFDNYSYSIFIYNPLNYYYSKYINYRWINDDYKKLDYYFDLLEKLTK